MSTDKDKNEMGGADSPVLLGPKNDPRLADQVGTLTGAALEDVLARLEAFTDDVFGSGSDEDPFPDGIKEVTAAQPSQAPGPDPVDAQETPDGDEDGLDLILDRLSDDHGEGGPEAAVPGEDTGPIRSLRDIAQQQQADSPAASVPRSPIADVLVGTASPDTGKAQDDYVDTGLSEGGAAPAGGPAETEPYDPLEDADLYSDYLDEDEEPPAEMDFDPDFPDEDDISSGTFPDADEDEDEEDEAGADDTSYALPEPSPYGDQDMMGMSYEDDEEMSKPDERLEDYEADGFSEPDEDDGADTEKMEDWLMPDETENVAPLDPGPEPDRQSVKGQIPADGGEGVSALDGLLSGLSAPADEEADAKSYTDPVSNKRGAIPSFLRNDGTARPPLSSYGEKAADPELTSDEDPASEPEEPAEPPLPADDEPQPDEAQTEAPRSGRKRMLAGVAALALLAAAGMGAYLYAPGLIPGADGPNRVAEANVPVRDLTPAEAPVFTAQDPDEGAQDVDVPLTAPTPLIEAPLEAAGQDDLSDLFAELSREQVEPEPVRGPSQEEFDALLSRLDQLETSSDVEGEREAQLTDELTALTDQITGLLQRDSDQAERLERMERLIRGQSAILAQFGQMEESLEQTQVVLLDVSARIGAVEGQNPADRDAVNRALSDVENRIQALTANMSILARMSIEGVDALRAPNASSGTVGVQTSPASQDPSGGADTVFRSETGGFRISSDPAGRIPAGVSKDDFIEGYGYVLDVLPASDGQRLVIMENGSVLIPSSD